MGRTVPRDREPHRLVTGAGQRLDTGTRLDTLRNELEHTLITDVHDTSALGEGLEVAPMVVHWTRSKDF